MTLMQKYESDCCHMCDMQGTEESYSLSNPEMIYHVPKIWGLADDNGIKL